MPWRDWQFWVVTALAVLAAAYLFRRLAPATWNPFRTKTPGVRTTLTIAGKAPKR